MYDPRTQLSAQVVAEVEKHFPSKVFRTRIPRSVRLSEAPSYGQPILTYAPTSSGAVAYAALAQEVLARKVLVEFEDGRRIPVPAGEILTRLGGPRPNIDSSGTIEELPLVGYTREQRHEPLPIAEHDASVVATHIRLAPRVPDPNPVYDNLLEDVNGFLADRAARAIAAGIPRERIMVDAGLDLGKNEAMSATLLRHSGDLVQLGFPVFLSASNKRFLGSLVGAEVDDRREATWAAHALGVALGCRVLRAHDVRGARRVADVMAEILAAR